MKGVVSQKRAFKMCPATRLGHRNPHCFIAGGVNRSAAVVASDRAPAPGPTAARPDSCVPKTIATILIAACASLTRARGLFGTEFNLTEARKNAPAFKSLSRPGQSAWRLHRQIEPRVQNCRAFSAPRAQPLRQLSRKYSQPGISRSLWRPCWPGCTSLTAPRHPSAPHAGCASPQASCPRPWPGWP